MSTALTRAGDSGERPRASGQQSSRLAAVQRLLSAGLDGRLAPVQAAALHELLAPSRVGQAAAALGVYRDSSRRARERALELVYPVCRQVLGARCFEAVAASLVRRVPSRSPDLTDLAGALPTHLARRPAALGPALGPQGELGYLPDLARLELAFHRALFAADDLPWDQAGFAAAVAADGAGRVRLRLGAAVSLLGSPWPIHEIWRRHRDRGATDAVPAGSGDRLVVCRSGYRPRVRRVSEPVLALLDGVRAGMTIGELSTAGHAVECLGGLIADGVIVGWGMGAGKPGGSGLGYDDGRAAIPRPAPPPARR